jgi:hypothetical protein
MRGAFFGRWRGEHEKGFLVLLATVIVLSCASVRYFPSTTNSYAPTDRCEVYWHWRTPEFSYTEIGLIVVESDTLEHKKMVEKLKKRAMAIGANGVILRFGPSKTYWFFGRGAYGFSLMSSTTIRLEGMAIRFDQN